MPCQKQDRHLIAQRLWRERGAGFGVARIDQGIKNIRLRRRCPAASRIKTGADHRLENGVYRARRRFGPPFIAQARQAIDPQHRAALGLALITTEGGIDLRPLVLSEAAREQRAKDDVGRDMAHHRININQRPGSGQLRHHRIHRIRHGRKSARQMRMPESRVHHCALIGPILPIGEEYAAAHQIAQHVVQDRMLGETPFRVSHDPLDLIKIADHKDVLTRQPDTPHLHRVALDEKRVDPAIPPPPEAPQQPRLAAQRLGVRRDERAACSLVGGAHDRSFSARNAASEAAIGRALSSSDR